MGVLVVEGRTTRSKLVRADASHRSHAKLGEKDGYPLGRSCRISGRSRLRRQLKPDRVRRLEVVASWT